MPVKDKGAMVPPTTQRFRFDSMMKLFLSAVVLVSVGGASAAYLAQRLDTDGGAQAKSETISTNRPV